MVGQGYEKGRLNLPFVGHCTFGKQPQCLNWDAIDADAAIQGDPPFYKGTQYRAGARFGPRTIREESILLSFGHSGAYDLEEDVTYVPTDQVGIVDIGDADIIHTDNIKSHDNIECGVPRSWRRPLCPWFLAATIRCTFPVSGPSMIKSPCA